MRRLLLGLAIAMGIAISASQVSARTELVAKKIFEAPVLHTVGGRTVSKVRVGWESYGKLNSQKNNVILITHPFWGNSHAAGRYKADDKAPGYWDSIIGPGKPIDTSKYFVLSVDTLVNVNAKDPMVTTTGPASIDPETGKPYGLNFPIITIRDFITVQKLLLDSLGIRKLHAVMGAGMGAMQVYEWASSFPEMVERAIPVVGTGDADGHLIAWLDMWAAPIKLDPNWNKGDYYGKAEPTAGLVTAMKLMTLQTQHWTWANSSAFGRKWASEGKDPAECLVDCRFAIEAVLDAAGRGSASIADANHFLYMVKANQLFVTGGRSLADGLKRITAPMLIIASDDDQLFNSEGIKQTADAAAGVGDKSEVVRIKGGRGHLDGIHAIGQVGPQIAAFLARVL